MKNSPFSQKATLIPLLLVGVVAIGTALAWRTARSQNTPSVPKTADTTYKFTNRLANATSPYLLEHAHNPVDWYPWGEEAFRRAKTENKPIFLSIGYSACHWCHVMAKEDFENEAIAKILNTNFVCIKVDKEQRTDVDAQYMAAVQLMTGQGGWPTSVFLMPDRKPFFGGTYFPPEPFTKLLNRVVELYKTQPSVLQEQADKVAAALASAASSLRRAPLPKDAMQAALTDLAAHFDKAQGGFSDKPKFPDAYPLAFLLAQYRTTGDKDALQMATLTLDRMADGGLYDQIGGGFHRYSTDALWRVPHFEKMLYDQATLVRVYLDAYEITKKPRYLTVATETLDFVAREMRDKDGGFTASLDADSEGVEGKFYVWTPEETKTVLGSDAPLFDALYGVTAEGDLEGKSVLHSAMPTAQAAKGFALSETEVQRKRAVLREKLRTAREKRIRPRTDDKVLTNWNGLMLAAFAKGYQVTKNETYRKIALESANFLLQKMTVNGQLQHSYRAGKAEIAGMLEDYAFAAHGLLALYDATRDVQWREAAKTLAAQLTPQFGDTVNGGFFATAAQGELMTRLKDGLDNVLPSGNGIAAQVCARLAVLTGEPRWRQEGLAATQAFGSLFPQAPSAFSSLLLAAQSLGTSPQQSVAKKVQAQARLLSRKPDGTATLAVKITIPDGQHLNANPASAPELIPTTLRLASGKSDRLTVRYPAGKKITYPFAPMSLSVYTGDVTIQATLRRTEKMEKSVRLVLRVQPCTDRACFPPTEIPLTVSLSAP